MLIASTKHQQRLIQVSNANVIVLDTRRAGRKRQAVRVNVLDRIHPDGLYRWKALRAFNKMKL